LIDGAAAYPAAFRNLARATALADLFAGRRWRRGSHDSQKPWRETPPMNIQEIGRMAVMA
jgi:hypothetical protein